MSLRNPSAGRSALRRTRARWVLACATAAIILWNPSCSDDNSDDDDGGSGLQISMVTTPPAGGATNQVFFSEFAVSGDLLLLEVLARDISTDFDSYNVEIAFDPMVAEAFDLSPGIVLEQCSGSQAVKADNVANGNANASWSIIFSASLTGPTPPACTVTGDKALARITFRAKGTGSFPLDFVLPNAPTGSRLSRTMPSMPVVAGITFDDGQTLIEVD